MGPRNHFYDGDGATWRIRLAQPARARRRCGQATNGLSAVRSATVAVLPSNAGCGWWRGVGGGGGGGEVAYSQHV